MIKTLRLALNARLMQRFWIATRTQIESATVPGSGGIAFIGDSITHMGKWDLLFPALPIRNLGIAGERSIHLFDRIDSVVALKPEKIFLLIGANDLGLGIAIDEIVANIAALLDRYRTALPGCAIHLQGVMPRERRFGARVKQLNERLRQLAAQRQVAFIDLFPALADSTGALRPAFTQDDLHLNGPGYVAWRDLLRPYLPGPCS